MDRFDRCKHTAWRRIVDQTVIIDLEGHMTYALDSSGGDIWHALDGTKGVAEIAGLTDLRPAKVDAFLSELEKRGLIVRSSDDVSTDGDPSLSAPRPSPASEEPSRNTPQEGPAILWSEKLRSAAASPGSCAFLPAQNALCNANPFS